MTIQPVSKLGVHSEIQHIVQDEEIKEDPVINELTLDEPGQPFVPNFEEIKINLIYDSDSIFEAKYDSKDLVRYDIYLDNITI